jgi:DnaJ-class molecular chaperone
VSVPLVAALLGGVLGEVLTITGEAVRLTVPEGAVAYPGLLMRVRGEGLPLVTDPTSRGDLFVRLHVEFPPALPLGPDDRAALQRMLAPAQQSPTAGEGTEGSKTVVAGADEDAGQLVHVERSMEPAT